MDESTQDWSDADFQSPPVRSLSDLTTSVRHRVVSGEIDARLIEDLRLFILTRLYQGLSQRQVEDEIQSWGLDPSYVIELVCSVITAGQFGEIEVYTETFVNGMSTGRYNNPVYKQKVRASERVSRLASEARRMVEAEAGSPATNLGFEVSSPASITSAVAKRSDRRRVILAFLIALTLLAAVSFFLL